MNMLDRTKIFAQLLACTALMGCADDTDHRVVGEVAPANEAAEDNASSDEVAPSSPSVAAPQDEQDTEPPPTEFPALPVEVPEPDEASTLAAKSIASGDIFAQIDPARPFSTYSWNIAHECAGKTGTFATMGEGGVTGSSLGGTYGSLRFGKVADPAASSRKVLLVRANRNDPLLYSAPRCEIGWASSNTATRIQVGQDMWFGFGLYLPSWTTVSEEAIIAQWHQSGPTVNPFMALAIKGNRLKLTLRYNANSSPKQSTNTVQVFDLPGDLPVNKWAYFVFKTKISWQTTKNPYLSLWRNGTQILSYKGRLGYNTAEIPFMKMGIYPWGYASGSNAWTTSVPTKALLFRAPTYVRDTKAFYTEEDVRAYVQGH